MTTFSPLRETLLKALLKAALAGYHHLSAHFQKVKADVSKTYVVNETLVAAVKLIKNNKNKKFEANLLLPKLEREEHVLDSLLEDLLDIDVLKKEIADLKAENAALHESLKSKQNNASKYGYGLGQRRRPD